MRGPPDRQKQHQQEPLHTRPVADPTGFDIEAATLAILKGRLDAHTQGILLDLVPAGLFITDKNPRVLKVLFPSNAHKGFDRLLLPDASLAKPAIATLEDQRREAMPTFLQFASQKAPTGMLALNAQEVMPTAVSTQLDQRIAC